MFGGEEERSHYENAKVRKYNSRSAFLHKTHLSITEASKVFPVLPSHEQENWAQLGIDLTREAAIEFEETHKNVETRKRLVDEVGPFGSSCREIPISVPDLFEKLTHMVKEFPLTITFRLLHVFSSFGLMYYFHFC